LLFPLPPPMVRAVAPIRTGGSHADYCPHCHAGPCHRRRLRQARARAGARSDQRWADPDRQIQV